MTDYIFPLSSRPLRDFESGERNFGARRNGGKRAHAGCDLIMEPGTPILAMADGKVTKGPYPFYSGTFALEVTHEDGKVVRYGEIKGQVPKGIFPNAEVRQGQIIAYVGRLNSGSSMLHLEMYKGIEKGRLTQSGANKFSRRKDLMDPTDILKRAKLIGEVRDSSSLSPTVRKQAPQPKKEKIYGTLKEFIPETLNVRREASLSSEVVTSLMKAHPKIEILQRVTGDPHPYGDHSTWYEIETSTDGREIQGFVVAYFITPDADLEIQKDLPKPTTGIVSQRLTGNLFVREGPDRDDPKHERALKAGDTVEILDPEVKGGIYNWDRDDWVKIKWGEQEAFAAGYYIDLVEPSQTRAGSKDQGQLDDDANEWDQVLLDAPTTGASSKTARYLGGMVGVQASHKMAEEDLKQVIAHADRFASAGKKTAVTPALLAAIASRESRCGRVLDKDKGWGDGGMAFGIMQIDKRHHEIRGRGGDPYSTEHIEQAAAIFNDNLVAVTRKHSDWEKTYRLKGAVAAYNFGPGHVRSKEGIDKGTTGDDYGSDVVARAQFYHKHPDLEIFRG